MRDSGTPVQTIRNDYASANVTTGAWVQLDASLDSRVSHAEISDSSGQVMELGYGPVGSEQRLILLPEGGLFSRFPLKLDAGMRLAVRAVSGDATSGNLIINFYG